MPFLANLLGSISNSVHHPAAEDGMLLRKPIHSVCELAVQPESCAESAAKPSLVPTCGGKEVDVSVRDGGQVVFNPECAAPAVSLHNNLDAERHVDRLYSYYLFVYSPVKKIGLGSFFTGENGVHHTSIVRCKSGISDKSVDDGQCEEFAHVTSGGMIQDRKLGHDFEEGRVASYPLGHLNDNWELDQVFFAGKSLSPHREVFGIDEVRAQGHSPKNPVDGNTTWFSNLYNMRSVNCNAFSQLFLERFLDTPSEPLPRANMQAAAIADQGYGTQGNVLFHGTLSKFYDNLLERRMGAVRIKGSLTES